MLHRWCHSITCICLWYDRSLWITMLVPN